MSFRSLAGALSGVALVLGSCGCASPRPPTPPPPDPPPDRASTAALTPAQPKKPRVDSTLDAQGLSMAALDKSVDPCQDFYQYACGGWEKATAIPDDRARWSRSFSEIDKRNEADLKAILEGGAAAKGKVGRFYSACMDGGAIDRAGAKPLRPLLDAVKRAEDPAGFTRAIATLHRHGVWAFFDVASGQDYKDAGKMIGVLDQNGLGLPDRDYYLKDDADKKTIRAKYVDHVGKLMKLAGEDEASAKASTEHVLRIETRLAEAAKSREERRNPATMYNRVDRVGLEKITPKLSWAAYFKELGFSEMKDLSITSPKFFERLEAILGEEKPEAIRAYLKWQVIRHAAPRLGKAFDDEDFAMQAILTGQKQQRERWKRCIDATDEALGELLAQPYVELRFGGESKAGAEKLVHEISRAMDERLNELDWMDAETREKARAKLKAMAFLIGYPDKWKKYDFEVGKAFFPNALAGAAFRVKDSLSKVGKPVDRGEWFMTPPTVNAYYDPQKNQMVFPAGILQPPFYSAKASAVVNLGAMGMVVGHELTHGFDDEGSQFDRDGNLSNWWSSKTAQIFAKKGECVQKQYSAYESLPGLKQNGKLTLGENIADAGGIKLAFRAYRSLRAPAKEEVFADGSSEDQQFFLSVGQIWCSEYREEAARLMAQVDPHAHPRFRVNGPLSHLPEFARAFQCKAGARMVAKEACSVW